MSTRILTWNLQGRDGIEPRAVAAVIAEARPDVVAFQEVQRAQAAAIGAVLGWDVHWRLKHWPVLTRAEGLALLAPVALTSVRAHVLAHPVRILSWRRRIAVVADVPGAAGPLRIVNTHLGAHVDDEERSRQAALTLALVRAGPSVIAGDLNVLPSSGVLADYGRAGFVDAWSAVRPGEPGASNWEPGPRDRPPTQRLDYVLVGPGLRAVAADVPVAMQPDFDRYPPLSDHLPVIVTVEPG